MEPDLVGTSFPASGSVSAWLQYNIEQDYDYLYGEVSTDGGTTWADAGPPVSGPADNAGLTPWAQSTWDLSAFAGKALQFRFRYATDGGVHYEGAFLDDLTVTVDGQVVVTDGAESGANGWTASGWSTIDGTTSKQVQRYYLAENRVYSGYDATLRTGPYNFGWTSTKPSWVERFPYQNGLLVTYANGEFDDNNTSAHPGGGQVLPVDARPSPIRFPDGVLLGNRRQPFDATFGQERTDKVTFHRNGVPVTVPSGRAIPAFEDAYADRYWTADNPQGSTKVAGTGLTITVSKTTHKGDDMVLDIRFRR